MTCRTRPNRRRSPPPPPPPPREGRPLALDAFNRLRVVELDRELCGTGSGSSGGLAVLVEGRSVKLIFGRNLAAGDGIAASPLLDGLEGRLRPSAGGWAGRRERGGLAEVGGLEGRGSGAVPARASLQTLFAGRRAGRGSSSLSSVRSLLSSSLHLLAAAAALGCHARADGFGDAAREQAGPPRPHLRGSGRGASGPGSTLRPLRWGWGRVGALDQGGVCAPSCRLERGGIEKALIEGEQALPNTIGNIIEVARAQLVQDQAGERVEGQRSPSS